MIIDALQKHKNDEEVQVKTPNIFSLAKKNRQNERQEESGKDEVDSEVSWDLGGVTFKMTCNNFL